MNKKHMTFFQKTGLTSLLLITGCAQNLIEQKEAIEQSQSKIEQAQTAHRESAREKPKTIEYPREQAWLYREIERLDYTMTLRDAVESLIPGQPVSYRMPANLNPVVSAGPENKTIKAHLDTMAMQANIHWEYAAGTLVFMPTLTRQYEIPLYGGSSNTTRVGSNNLVSGNAGAGVTNSLEATTNLANEINSLINATLQISNCRQNQQSNQAGPQQQGNIQAESPRALAGIPAIAEPAQIQECYVISGAGNLITITARPQTLLRFETAFDGYLKSLHRHVALKIITVKIDVTDLSQQRLDLDILYETNSVNASATNITSDLTSSGVSGSGELLGAVLDIDLTRATSPWAGSNLILQNLNSISNISVEDNREVLAYSNRLITIQDTERFSYVKEVRRDPETVGQITTIRTSIESDEVFTGQAINILPSLTAETIGLHIVINESTLTNIKTDGTSEATITLPDTANSDVVFDVTLRDKQTALIASSIRTETTTKEDKSGFLPVPLLDRILSNSNEGQTRTYQTLYVIEAAFRD